MHRARKHRLPLAAYRGIKTVAFTACVKEYKRLYEDAEVVSTLIPMLAGSAVKYECLVPINCFMPDHLHVVITGQSETANAKLCMDSFKYDAGFWVSQNRPEFDLQGDYYDHVVRVSEDWRHQVAYVYLNPVRAGLVADGKDYPYTGSIGYDLDETIFDAFG